MTIETQTKRAEWVESEFKKWQEHFIISFDEEFEVKAILDLQWQYNNIEDNHVKSKSDILYTISRAKRDLGLKPRVKTESEVFHKIISESLPIGTKVITSEIGFTLRDQNIKFIKEINSKAIDKNDHALAVTKMFYKNNGNIEYVEDYSPFANEKYMSKGLLEALANGTTLTTQQDAELKPLIIESRSFYI